MQPRRELPEGGLAAAAASPRALGIGGSLRRTSKTSVVLDAVMASLTASGAKSQTLTFNALPLPLFSGYTYSDAEALNLRRFCNLVADHDLLVLASPEYHGAASGSLKNALDHLAEGSLRGKVVGLVGVAGGSVSPVATTSQLRSVVRTLGGVASPCELLVTRSKHIFDEAGKVTDAQVIDRIEMFAEQLLMLSGQLVPPFFNS